MKQSNQSYPSCFLRSVRCPYSSSKYDDGPSRLMAVDGGAQGLGIGMLYEPCLDLVSSTRRTDDSHSYFITLGIKLVGVRCTMTVVPKVQPGQHLLHFKDQIRLAARRRHNTSIVCAAPCMCD